MFYRRVAGRCVGIELGGTKCIATLADADGEVRILAQETLPTGDPATTLPALRALVDRWRSDTEVVAMGIAGFGPLDLDPASRSYGHVLATAKPGWRDAPVLPVIARGLSLPVAIDTDVNAAAMAEIRWGAGRGLTDFAYVTVGTGVGVGIVTDGRTPRGLGHSEAGHLRVPNPHGLASNCPYHPDCVEGLAAGPAIRRHLDGRSPDDVGADDPLWNQIADVLAAMIHALAATTSPRLVALGGGVIVGQPHLVAKIDAATRASVNGYLELPTPYVVPASLGAQAGPLGSIALALGAIEPAEEKELA